eukprot:jgi/Chlat1/8008/Chrsp7S00634
MFRQLLKGFRRGNNDDEPKLKMGVCALDKKARSKPMQQILERIRAFGDFEVIIFGDQMILEQPVESWPACHCLIAFFSYGFPLHKAEAYAKLRRPFLFNDLPEQRSLYDRRIMYSLLRKHGITTPEHIIVNRDEGDRRFPVNEARFIEDPEYVELDGVRITKPFVEKPADGEDHRVNIYYPSSVGGGMKSLFRKVGDRSSDFNADQNKVRRNGSFIYETFMPTGGTDVKVYTVGPDYAHAEARKAPTVDGRVVRSADGKEVRFPVLLTPEEKEIARQVCQAFKQSVCGFDLLRSKGKSYVCDVNGWSFVKNSHKYYDDAACLLRSMALKALAPHRLLRLPPALVPTMSSGSVAVSPGTSIDGYGDDKREALGTPLGKPSALSSLELRCCSAAEFIFVWHTLSGDRTPKQKMKMLVTQPLYLDILMKYNGGKTRSEAKLKSAVQLQDLLDATRSLLPKKYGGEAENCVVEEDENEEVIEQLLHVKAVLEEGGSFSGINRKVQLKPMAWTEVDSEEKVTQALLILKYGGVLTHAGRKQAETLGNDFRLNMYPGEQGTGLLRLHSTYRHDLKLYTSDEGRVQMSAAAFAKGLLDLEGPLTPILVSLVSKDAAMLDYVGSGADDEIRKAKAQLYTTITGVPYRPHSWSARDDPSPAPSPMKPPWAGNSSASGPDFMSLADSLPLPAYDGNTLDQPEAAVQTPRSPGSVLAVPLPSAMPASSEETLHRLVELIKSLTEQLHGHCRAMLEGLPSPLEGHRRKGSLSVFGVHITAPSGANPNSTKSSGSGSDDELDVPGMLMMPDHTTDDWHGHQEHGCAPCGGESFLLMHARWSKLQNDIYNERKGRFDISKIPDIYDSVKYDSLHNSHLGLTGLDELYAVAKVLADGVIPNEYGIDPSQKLKIGALICNKLLRKLIIDLNNTRNESLEVLQYSQEQPDAPPLVTPTIPRRVSTGQGEMASSMSDSGSSAGRISADTDVVGIPGAGGGDEDDGGPRPYKLDTRYAKGVKSPNRHVRTRIYFTSESHIHSLINVLRYCHLDPPCADGEALMWPPVVCDQAQHMLVETGELDYLTHIVFRMYENMDLDPKDPQRFQVEVLFSPGSAYNPLEVIPRRNDHVLPIVPRQRLHSQDEIETIPLQQLEALVNPYVDQSDVLPGGGFPELNKSQHGNASTNTLWNLVKH